MAKNILMMISGGPDSATLAYEARREVLEKGGKIDAIYLRGGHAENDKEIESADSIMEILDGKLEIIDITGPVRSLDGKHTLIHSEAAIMQFGNAFSLSLAMAYAFQTNKQEIWLALHADDAEESREYTRGFIDCIEKMASVAYDEYPKIITPYLNMSKIDVFKRGKELCVDYTKTWSCIRDGDIHCGSCGACRSRHKAFNVAEMKDPTIYRTPPSALNTV